MTRYTTDEMNRLASTGLVKFSDATHITDAERMWVITVDNRDLPPAVKSCWRCSHLVHQVESWEMPHIAWEECACRPGMSNLRSFPFSNTKCLMFKASQPRVPVNSTS